MMVSKTIFVDLNIPYGPACQFSVEAAFERGYQIVAINTTLVVKDFLGFTSRSANGSKKSKKRKYEQIKNQVDTGNSGECHRDDFPSPPTSKSTPWIQRLLTKFPENRILHRLTLVVSDMNDVQKGFFHPNAKLFDILAVIPKNHDVLLGILTSTSLVLDLISFDFEGPHWMQRIRLNRSKGDLADEKDIYFELTYGSILHGDNSLENLIYTSNVLMENICVKRLKNVVLSSGAQGEMEIKHPNDVLSLANLLSLPPAAARIALQNNPQRIIEKSDNRKYGRTWGAFLSVDGNVTNTGKP